MTEEQWNIIRDDFDNIVKELESLILEAQQMGKDREDTMDDDSATPPDSHLALPITLDECEDLLTMKRPCKRHKILTDLRDELGIKHTIYKLCTDTWGCIESWVRREGVQPPDIREALSAATLVTDCEVNFTTKGSGHFTPS
jgi:hypothetical protein